MPTVLISSTSYYPTTYGGIRIRIRAIIAIAIIRFICAIRMVTSKQAQWAEHDIRMGEAARKAGKPFRVVVVQLGEGLRDGAEATDFRQD